MKLKFLLEGLECYKDIQMKAYITKLIAKLRSGDDVGLQYRKKYYIILLLVLVSVASYAIYCSVTKTPMATPTQRYTDAWASLAPLWLNLTKSGVSKDSVSPPSSEYTPLLYSR